MLGSDRLHKSNFDDAFLNNKVIDKYYEDQEAITEDTFNEGISTAFSVNPLNKFWENFRDRTMARTTEKAARSQIPFGVSSEVCAVIAA